MSGLLWPDVLWLLRLRQGWFGGAGAAGETSRNLLLKLPIPKYPDFCENYVSLPFRDFLRGCPLGGAGSQSVGILAGSKIHPNGGVRVT